MNIENFYTPKDKLTTRYAKAMEKFDKLPASFYLENDDNPDSQGTPNLELKKQFIKPMKYIPEYSKLLDGSYHTEKTNSDPNIARSISFFVSNLPSFKKYKDTDDLSFIIDFNRLLTIELFEYYSKKPDTSLRTLEGRFVAICRIFYIAYYTKQYELYNKYSDILLDLNAEHKMDETDQKLNPIEEKSFVPFEIVMETQQKLENEFTSNKSYKSNQDLLLISLYSLIPIMRDELKLLEFTNTKKNEGDFIYFNGTNTILNLNNTKKKHDGMDINLSKDAPHLADIIETSYKLFPRQYVFTNYDDINKKAEVQNLSRRIIKIFNFTGKNVGVNSLRSSYATYQDKDRMTVKQKEELAKKMRTSRKYLDLNYIKILPNTQTPTPTTMATIETTEPKPVEMNAYQKQLLRSWNYYEKNKEKV
jgi:DNA polymerase IIIc chi subunit